MTTYTKQMTVDGQPYKVVMTLNWASEEDLAAIDERLYDLEMTYQSETSPQAGLLSFGQTPFGQALRQAMTNFIANQTIRMMWVKPIVT